MIIGIDPDREKSGVARLGVKNRVIELYNMAFPELLDFIQAEHRKIGTMFRLLVVVEAGWMVPSVNFHPSQGRRAQKIAYDVGANAETGRKIVEMCRHWGIEVREQHPLKLIWRKGKISADEFQQVTGFAGRCNQDARDAGLIAWYAADLPFRLRV
ncbi:MAG: hypothetical protein SPJ13_01270 [Bacteroidales bacterium]|nr:hypothetical protein [Bacteroidales bacterium]